ncbi:MAG: efflux RND transporter periplasmic adaptor subunit [Candidatus Latescibacterota bacterium]|jgi:RND family efflux transporter MFP subunit
MNRPIPCRLGVSILILVGATAVLAQMPPTLVETGEVVRMEFHDKITLVGRTEALANSQIVAEVTGRVVRIDASEGTWVAKGTTLVSIDPRRVRYALDAKKAEVAQAEAQSQLARKNLARSRDLHDQTLVSEGALDEDEANATRASEWHKQMLAQQKQLELDLENCSIRAPYGGYTVRQLVDIGEWVNPGTPVYEMVDLDRVKVNVDLPERYFGHVEIGSEVSITVSGNSGGTVTGTVAGIAPSAIEDTHTYPVIITVDNRDHRLGGGMLVRSTLSLSDKFESLAVNKDAIVRQGPQTMVYTITDGKAVPITVTVGSTAGNMIAVSGEGLTEGTPVVIRGNERVFPGSPVRTAGEPDEQSSGEDEAAGDNRADGEQS